MTLVIFSWLVQQRYFKEMTNLDIRQKLFQDQMEVLEQDMLPFGLIDDGLAEETFKDNDGQTWNVVEDPGRRVYY